MTKKELIEVVKLLEDLIDKKLEKVATKEDIILLQNEISLLREDVNILKKEG